MLSRIRNTSRPRLTAWRSSACDIGAWYNTPFVNTTRGMAITQSGIESIGWWVQARDVSTLDVAVAAGRTSHVDARS